MSKTFMIALTTYRELVRSRILFVVIFFAVILVAVSALFGTVTIGDQIKIVKDFGLMSISLCSTAFAMISGTALLNKELSRKTIYNILAKPVERWDFIVGKYLGMLATATLLVVLMSLGLELFLLALEGHFSALVLEAALFIVFELIIICAAAIFFSSIVVTPVLAGLFTFGIFVAGRSCEYLLYFLYHEETQSVFARTLLQLSYLALPHLDRLNISDNAVYGVGVSLAYVVLSLLHAVGYAAAMLVFAHLIFSRRDFN